MKDKPAVSSMVMASASGLIALCLLGSLLHTTSPVWRSIAALLLLAHGVLSGVVAAARWWVTKMRDLAFARRYIGSLYQTSHAHWLQVSRTDDTPVCPVCGYSEERAAWCRRHVRDGEHGIEVDTPVSSGATSGALRSEEPKE